MWVWGGLIYYIENLALATSFAQTRSFAQILALRTNPTNLAHSLLEIKEVNNNISNP